MKALVPLSCVYGSPPRRGCYLPLYRIGLKPDRKFFRTKEEARVWLDDNKDSLKKYGAAGHIPDNLRMEWIQADQYREQVECPSFLDALRFWRDHNQGLKPTTISEAIKQFMSSRDEANRRESYLAKMNWVLSDLAEHVGAETLVHTISQANVRSWADAHNWKLVTRKSNFVYVQVFLQFCKDQRMVMENVLATMARITVPRLRREILAPEDCRKLLDWTLVHNRPMLPYLVLRMFTGIRGSEIQRIREKDFRRDELHMGEESSKTWDERIIPITPQIRCWLDVEPFREWDHGQMRFQRGFHQMGEQALGRVMDRNILRHTAATYMIYKFGRAQTALILGNSEDVLESNYKGKPVELDQVEQFYSITPIWTFQNNQREPVPSS